MWINVETEFLDNLSYALRLEVQNLEKGACAMHDYTQNASATLEGRQYSLSVAETKQVCDTINGAADNMINLASYVSALSDHIQDYFKCTYNRG